MEIKLEGRTIRPAFTKSQIQKRIKELGAQITKDYEGKDLVCIGILNGVIFFFTDLVRNIDLPLSIDFLRLSSYEGEETTGIVTNTCTLKNSVAGKHVLLIEDIIDTGTTIFKSNIIGKFIEQGALSCKIAALATKPVRLKYPINVDYLGFEFENNYVVGYGFDLDEEYRNVEDIFYID